MMERKAFITRWRKMLKLQARLDERIVKGNGLTYKDLLYGNRYVSAILDEIGELNHELKADWCWWKKTQAPVNREKVLEEFVDCLHFVLSWQIATVEVEPYSYYRPAEKAWNAFKRDEATTVPRAATYVNGIAKWCGDHYVEPPVGAIIRLMNGLGFNIEEVYNAYMTKNRINHERQDNGY